MSVDFIAADIIPNTSEYLWIEEFLVWCIVYTLGTLIIVSVCVYYDFVFENEMQRFEKDTSRKRTERKEFLCRMVNSTYDQYMARQVTLCQWIAINFLQLSIPGGHVNKSIENFGLHHLGEIAKYVCGFVVPISYGMILTSMGTRLYEQHAPEQRYSEGEHLGAFIASVGYVTIFGVFYAQFCEVWSRWAQFNPKVTVTEQDTFKRPSVVERPSLADYNSEHSRVDPLELELAMPQFKGGTVNGNVDVLY